MRTVPPKAICEFIIVHFDISSTVISYATRLPGTPAISKDRADIITLLTQATLAETGGPPDDRIQAALMWVAVAVKWSDESAIEAYRTALRLLEIILATHRSMEIQYELMSSPDEGSQTRSLAVDGAACAIARGQIGPAVEMLEQGRSMLLTQAGRYRTEVDDLQAQHAGFAEEFRTISLAMEASVMQFERPMSTGIASIPAIDDPITKYV